VQLVHCTTETYEDHSFVRIKSADGELLSEVADYQDNLSSTRCRENHKRCYVLESIFGKVPCWENTTKLTNEVLAKYPPVSKPSMELRANLDARCFPPLKGGKHRMPKEQPWPGPILAMAARAEEAAQRNASMRRTPKASVQQPSRRSASFARSGSTSSSLANNGQIAVQYRMRSNSTTR